MSPTKNEIFEYFIYKVLQKYPDPINNDLSILKSLKLFFFLATIDCEDDDTFLNQFTFYAMPYGHVEGDIYDAIRNKFGQSLTFFNIGRDKTTYIGGMNEYIVSLDNTNIVDGKIENLLKYNNNIFEMSSFDLVNLSHQWYSWKYFFAKAREKNCYQMEISNNIILKENKIYSF